MFDIRDERPTDGPARNRLLDACFGSERFRKTSERLREGRLPAEGLALVVESDGELAATVRLWNVAAGLDRPALLLGPIAVSLRLQGLGVGSRLMRETLARATELGHRAVLLVGDEPYYRRFGFTAEAVSRLSMPGPWDRKRFLGLELVPGALAGAAGKVSATGRFAPRSDLAGFLQATERAAARTTRAA